MSPLGADPEFFIKDKNGKFHSIIGLIGGSKHKPKYIDDNGDFKIQEDNVAAEYNIPPSYTKEQFVQNILWPQKYIAALLGTDKFTISKAASAKFPPGQLKHPKAQEFGCDPDYNAYTLEMNVKPECEDKTFRTCGGHIHVGLDDKSPENLIRVIRAMDAVVGVWSVIADKDTKRRVLYGKAAAFRPQPHGVEYRTLSNFWIFNKALIEEVWDRTQHALTLDIPQNGEFIAHIINTGNKDAAREYLKANGY